MDNRNILALDVSTQATGYALYSKGNCIKHGVVSKKIRKNEDWLFRVSYMSQILKEELKDDDIDLFVIEDSYSGRNVKTLKKLCLAQGLLIGSLLNGRELTQSYPKEWQAFYGLAKMKRDDIKAHSIKIASKLLEEEIKTDDEADAILIGNYIVNKTEK